MYEVYAAPDVLVVGGGPVGVGRPDCPAIAGEPRDARRIV